ncbi:hypothetical protein ABES02_28090 [Neobacillus pocheonensis]|uniref:hypothetical protein n=1 Tax=Neobacillus pocheonensis TaxID=363869 RepID=UPI003D2A1818
MLNLNINDVQKIIIKENKSIYSYVATKEEILSWNANMSATPSYFLNDILIVISKSIKEKIGKDNLSIELSDPIIISKFSNIQSNEKQLVIFKEKNLPELLLNSILSSSTLNNLVEMKSTNLSKKSLKLITFSSLEKLIIEIYDTSYFENTLEIVGLFQNYLEQLICVNDMYFPNSLREVLNIKDETIIHNINSWYIFLCFFKEQIEDNKVDIVIPNLSKGIKYKNWTGSFFNRANPIWQELYGNTRQHYPSKKNRIEIYKHWKRLTESSFE